MGSHEPDDGDHYLVDTPERVDLEYDLSSLGSRLLAAIVDTALLAVLYILVAILGSMGLSEVARIVSGAIEWLGLKLEQTTFVYAGLAVVALLTFSIFWGYYLFFELVWNGQSPGKRWVGLRVIKEGGYPLGFTESAVRNLVRLVDFLPLFYGIGAVAIFIDRRSRRLGDLAAGTLVVKERRELSLKTLGFVAVPERDSATAGAPELDVGEEALPSLYRLTPNDQTVLREYLLRRASLTAAAEARLASQLAVAFARKLEYDLSGEPPERFLRRLARQLGLG